MDLGLSRTREKGGIRESKSSSHCLSEHHRGAEKNLLSGSRGTDYSGEYKGEHTDGKLPHGHKKQAGRL